jgi:hypothetical protein
MAYSGTATLGYKLTPNLLTRLEMRYDTFDTDDANQEIYPQGGAASDSEFFGLVNVAYVFD